MTQVEFRDALQKGLGRAYLYVKEHGDKDIRDDLLHYCLHNPYYDPQCEDERAEWMLSIVDLTKNPEFYFQRAIESLADSDDWDALHLFLICSVLAKRGMDKARSAIYRKFDLGEVGEFTGAKVLVDLDGIAGLRHVAQAFGKKLSTGEDDWDYGYGFNCACEKFGESSVLAHLEQSAQTDPHIKIYLDNAISERLKKSKKASDRSKSKRDLKTILADIEECKGRIPGYYVGFGRTALPEELKVVFDKVLTETRKDQLLRCLWVFRRAEAPKLDNKLFLLAKSTDREIQDAALSALSNSSEPRIRQLAIELSKSSEPAIRVSALELFINNYEPGDHKVIKSMLVDVTDIDNLHGGCMDAIKIFENHNDPDLAEILLWAYEKTPCSNCREWIVKALAESSLLPESQLLECQYDCVEDIRNLALDHLQKPKLA